jgi:ribosomal-protein-alanine N-acetyltransferase
MEEQDIQQVYVIEQASFSLPWSEQDFMDSLRREDTIYLVACEEEKIVGYCGLWNIVGEGNINNVAVCEAYRGQQIGFMMLTKLMEIGDEENIEAYTLEVRKSNRYAIRLYQKLGFLEEGIRKNFYENPIEDAIIMWHRKKQ